MVRVLALLAALSLMAAGCGDDQPPTATSARELAAVLADRGVGCRDFRPEAGGDGTGDVGACSVAGERVNLAVFESQQERDRGTIERFKGCLGRQAFNKATGTPFAFVRGPTWLVVSVDRPAIAEIGAATHTDVETAPC